MAPMPAPKRRIACGACSRDEPQPKFLFTSRTLRARETRVVERRASCRLRASCSAVVFERVLAEPVEHDGLQVASRE